MRSLPAPDNRLYLGKGGSGKTTLALSHTWRFERVIVCDPNGESAHTKHARVISDKAALVEAVNDPGQWRVCWRFDQTGFDDGFEWVNRVAWARGDLCLVWDEADQFTRWGLPPTAFRIWNNGRHRRLRVFACSRRPARVPRDMTANLTRACVFRTQEPRDLSFIREFTVDGESVGAVRSLGAFEAVDWTEAGWAVKKSPFD